MVQTVHLIVEVGPDKGREISVPVEGVRIGRSSRNDITLIDPSVSRFHCRFSVKPGDGLWLSDLGSANQTLVNANPAQEQRLHVGDLVTVGNTVIKVVHDGADSAPVPPPSAPGHLPEPAASFDLGLRERPREERGPRIRRLLVLAAVMAAIAAAAWAHKTRYWQTFRTRLAPKPHKVEAAVPAASLPDLQLQYEKISATPSNIFRYYMEIGDTLIIQVDDLQNNRQVRKEKKVDPAVLAGLAKAIESSSFFELLDDYQGVIPNVYDVLDLSVTLQRRTHRTRVVNRIEPDVFRTIREAIEEFGRTEVGLAALALEPERLIEMARNAVDVAHKLYDEKEIRYGNLAQAVRSCREAEVYLETIEPKPDFYAEAVGLKGDCERELQKRYDDLSFLAERAIKLRDWKEASKHLNVICELVPDRSDARNQGAFKKLVDVDRHLKAGSDQP